MKGKYFLFILITGIIGIAMAGIGVQIENLFTQVGNTLVLDGLQSKNESVFKIKTGDNELSFYSGRLQDGTDGFSIGTTSNTTLRFFQNNKDILTLDRNGNIVLDSIIINTVSALPTCTILRRGNMLVLRGGLGQSDNVYVCLKDNQNNFNWKTL